MSSIGYRHIGQFLRGELTLEAAARQIKFETHRFIRHQYAWFRLKDDRIHWFDIPGEINTEIEEVLTQFVNGA